MTVYGGYIRELLEPLGVYTFAQGSLSLAEAEAMGTGLDFAAAALDLAEREALLPTAEGAGLDRRAALFARQPVTVSTQLRREAIMALSRMGEGDFTLSAINSALAGCGVKAEVQELEEQGHVRVIFPQVAGVPPEFDQIRGIILDILPLHLEVEFYFRYQTWAECEAYGWTWAMVEAAEHTWQSFELAV